MEATQEKNKSDVENPKQTLDFNVSLYSRNSNPPVVAPVESLFRQWFLGFDKRASAALLAGRALLWIFLLLWGLTMITSPLEEGWNTFLHNVNLPIHETAHLVFTPFGKFMHFLGGSLGQILLPFILMIAFLVKKRDAFAAAVCLWWTGQNFLDIAPYIADARAQAAPLVGGGIHDWGWLLGTMRIMPLDRTIAKAVFGTGAVIMILAMLWAAGILWLQAGRRIDKTSCRSF